VHDRLGSEPDEEPARRLPRARSGLPASRRWAGLLLAGVGLPLVTVLLVAVRDSLALESVLLLYLLAVVVVSVVGGVLPGMATAVASFLLANFFFTTPYHTFVVDQRDSVIALIVFIGVALTVSITVNLAERRRVAAARSRAEAEILSRLASEPVTDSSAAAVLHQIQTTFGMTSVGLLLRDGCDEQVVASVGPPLRGDAVRSVPVGGGLRLVAEGPEPFAEDRRMLDRLAAAAARAWEGQQLAGEAAQARQLADVDRLRAALLAAVGHDLRTPLAGIKAAVTGLRQPDVAWTPPERDELLQTIEESANRLDDLIANLLAAGRLQAGTLSAVLSPVTLDEVVARALLDLHTDDVAVDVADSLPLVLADAGLLERVVANLVANARRFSPAAGKVRLEAEHTDNSVRLRVIDHGPGVPETDWDTMFAPFQTLHDRSAGAGLGLAIARGFTEAMHGTVEPSTTPGGGLTMTVTLRVAS
jgi:K+-sensing histidine kinase KdpD